MRRTLALLLTLTMAAPLALAGCSDGDKGRDAKPSATSEKRPETVDGIPTGAGTHKQKLDVGTPGHREFLLHVPPKLAEGEWRGGKPGKPLPLVLALHGGLANMGKMRTLTGYDRIADDQGFLVAYPDGFLTTWNAGDCCGAAKLGNIDDVGFLDKLIGKLTRAGLADPDRVYASGFSNGAGMAYRLACERPGKVAGIGVVEGALVTECDPGRPVSAMIVHGTADRSVPYDGGGRRDLNDGRPYPPVSQAVDFWRRVGGLPKPAKSLAELKGLSNGAECTGTGKGRGGAEVALCRIEGGTHRWPAGASTMLWKFFDAHPRVS